jgi:hypothetical protein
MNFLPTRTQLCFLSHPIHLIWLQQTFFISKTEINFERTTISDDSRDYEKFTDGATRDPEKGVPGLFPELATALGAVHQSRRGVL